MLRKIETPILRREEAGVKIPLLETIHSLSQIKRICRLQRQMSIA